MTNDTKPAGRYGQPPTLLGTLELPEWREFMHYLYLPVRLPLHERAERTGWTAFPKRLQFLEDTVRLCVDNARSTAPHLSDPYVYVTARRGFASPGNPLNRPGWHCDDFGGTDLNYTWCDGYPTRFLVTEDAPEISPDDMQSMQDFEALARQAWLAWRATSNASAVAIVTYPAGSLLRLTSHVIHATPEIPSPGGMRSFFKISVSTHRYNLLGNSHNYDLDYSWQMYDRAEIRNQPDGNRDYVVAAAERSTAGGA